jgi:hypothetical protein
MLLYQVLRAPHMLLHAGYEANAFPVFIAWYQELSCITLMHAKHSLLETEALLKTQAAYQTSPVLDHRFRPSFLFTEMACWQKKSYYGGGAAQKVVFNAFRQWGSLLLPHAAGHRRYFPLSMRKLCEKLL